MSMKTTLAVVSLAAYHIGFLFIIIAVASPYWATGDVYDDDYDDVNKGLTITWHDVELFDVSNVMDVKAHCYEGLWKACCRVQDKESCAKRKDTLKTSYIMGISLLCVSLVVLYVMPCIMKDLSVILDPTVRIYPYAVLFVSVSSFGVAVIGWSILYKGSFPSESRHVTLGWAFYLGATGSCLMVFVILLCVVERILERRAQYQRL